MKKYKVRAIMKFNDGVENKLRTPENENAEFFCTEERYNVLKKNNAVKLIEIVNDEDFVSEEEVQAVAITIKEEAEEQGKTVEEIVDEIVDEFVESEEMNNFIDNTVDTIVEEMFEEKPKKKKSSKK